MGAQLAFGVPGTALTPAHASIQERLQRAGLEQSSLRRYLGSARSWLRFCADHEVNPVDAPTAALISWLDARCRDAASYASSVRIGLASARHVQRALALEQACEPLPYARSARPALDAWCASVVKDSAKTQRARALRLDTLATLASTIRAQVAPRQGVPWERALLLAKRDVAMILVGWWGAFRADDLARLQWADLSCAPEGFELSLRDSKTGGALVALATQTVARLCPVRALNEYSTALGASRQYTEDASPVFGLASGSHVSRQLRRAFIAHGCGGYTGHSLRAGFATECAAQGLPDHLVRSHARWTSTQQHAEYVRSGRLWLDTPTRLLRLPEDL